MSLLDGEALSFEETLRAQLADDSLYQDSPLPVALVGRKMKNPFWLWNLYNQCISPYRSARAVQREFESPAIWRLVEDEALCRFPDRPEMWPVAPYTRYEYDYLQRRIASDTGRVVVVPGRGRGVWV